LSVALGITSVLVVSVVQRSREIGILRAMGISQGQILRVFLLQGGLLGLGGSMIGCLIGISALLLWQNLMRNPDGTAMIPIVLNAMLFIVTFGLASITGLGAAVAPALRAARLDPVAAIRA
jgi:lipoprotein-releasing system permease protein